MFESAAVLSALLNVTFAVTLCNVGSFIVVLSPSIPPVLVTTHPHPIQAETGKGKDVFKVIMTIFGVDESKGDVVAIVTAKDEQAKVKLFDASGPEVVPLNATEGGGHLIEYVATFPNLTVNSGDEYKACFLLSRTTNLRPQMSRWSVYHMQENVSFRSLGVHLIVPLKQSCFVCSHLL